MKLSGTHDFGDGKGKVSARRHINPDKSVGGWVADTATAAATTWIGPDAQVYGTARVTDEAWISDTAQIYGHALIFRDTWILGAARVCGAVEVSGRIAFADNALIAGTNPGRRITVTESCEPPVRIWIGNNTIIARDAELDDDHYDTPFAVLA